MPLSLAKQDDGALRRDGVQSRSPKGLAPNVASVEVVIARKHPQ